MKSRKTIEVETIKKIINERLESIIGTTEGRKELAMFLSTILFKTGNYHGFNYLPSETDIHAGMYGEKGRVFFY